MNPTRISMLGVMMVLGAARLAVAEPALPGPDLSTGWIFKTGDDPSWSDPSLDETQWRPIRLGSSWEDQGFADYDGYAWYRVHLRIPGTLRNDRSFRRHQTLKITLGKIDDVDQTWLNGHSIGKTGAFPDAYRPAWLTSRVYYIPATLIRWDADNVVAVRVYDGNGHGGMVQGAYRLEVATWSDFLEIDYDLGRGDGVFVQKGAMPIAVTLRNKTLLTATGAVHWTIEDDEGDALSTSSTTATLPAHGKDHAVTRFAPPAPGFYRVTCEFRSQDETVVVASSITLGYRPEEVTSALTRKDDFDNFWRHTLDALGAITPQFQITRRPAMDSDTHEVYEVGMRSLGEVRVRGWYEKPKAKGNYPAVLRLPGYGANMQPTGSSQPIAFFSFNVRGHGNSQSDVSGTPHDYWLRGLDDKEGYFYQGAYADCVRAVDFLASRPELDSRRIAVTGGSQGGGLSLATAALDHRISLCAPDIPFLCDWIKYFKASDWPEMQAWVDADPHRSWEATLRTLSYFDTLNLADRIHCPVFLALGLQDAVCPPATIFAVYNRLSVPKQYRLDARAGHWVDASHQEERRKWILSHFRAGHSNR